MPSGAHRPSAGTKKAGAGAAKPGKPNGSILNFFRKVDSPLKDDSIFLSPGSHDVPSRPGPGVLDEDIADLYADDDAMDLGRFNEAGGSVKRRKTSDGSTSIENGAVGCVESDANGAACAPPPIETQPKSKKPRRRGPFLSDSDTEDEIDDALLQKFAVHAEEKDSGDIVASETDTSGGTESKPGLQEDIEALVPSNDLSGSDGQSTWERRKGVPVGEAEDKLDLSKSESQRQDIEKSVGDPAGRSTITGDGVLIPSLKREITSMDEWGNFDDAEDFPDDDEYAGGEEAMERAWMEEQARLEAAEEGQDAVFNDSPDDGPGKRLPGEVMAAACPICEADLGSITPDEATRHVNGCLDGNPIPLPGPVTGTDKPELSEVKFMPAGANSRFARKAAIPRPGQANPFQIGSLETTQPTAFSKLMSGHAEDAAWASAAAAEQSARGKPAYQRTCPFYKIMPGFFICVDAFRYGAVQGCHAYFLSHFHSDHYVGLTSSWGHGPIYCSKVTANLVKQQLRVDPKWVVALDFDSRFEVPGTQGVAVTMIPANHCPGSSLFLFEKTVGRGPNPKVQRVLHCGDFRACPAHIAHPLLKPDIVDSITGKTKQQKIDVCYLDTTYLNPRYSFPSQEDVTKACADLCVSLAKERAEDSDAWEVVTRERAGAAMAKFVSKPEDATSSTHSSRARGRLLVVCGTYSIGKERICMSIARALDCKIWAPPGKRRICAALEDPELMSRMTADPTEAQIHMQALMEIRPETLQEYLHGYKPHFSRVVGFRPSGWNYRPPTSRFVPLFSLLSHPLLRQQQQLTSAGRRSGPPTPPPASPRSCTRHTGAPPSLSATSSRSAAARARWPATACPTRSTAASAS
jgi:DNA cross-link repair 1A protein